MNNLSVKTTIIVFIVIAIITLATFLYLEYMTKHGKSTKKVALYASANLFLISAIVIVINIIPMMTGFSKGMSYVKWEKLSLSQMKEMNQNTPDADKLPSDTKNSIIILYKYGCPDCVAIHDELHETIKETNAKVYFIQSGSPEGQKFVQEGNITNVPSAVYIRNEPLANGATFNSVQLYTLDVHDKPYFNKSAFERLALLQEQKR